MSHTLKQVDTRGEEMIMTARAVLACALNPAQRLDVTEIAMATGLTREAVRHVLGSQTYQRLISDEIRMLVSGSLMRGVRRLDEIVNGEKTTHSNAIAAHRAVVHTYQAITQARPADDNESKSDEQLKNALKLIQALGKKNQTP